ncbi:hypothetical protein RJ639_023311 [Escallonia herrerae]|uniref:EF-hand domain-containing protein n=1 Tax=Escallonia herrerae TaxID=1293975 RepID=A0AA89ACY3_9ASTE|nr:hypothetical protein RJ639_023311 [Escallonia herrerae]
MGPDIVPKSFGCFPHQCLKLNFSPRRRSKSSSDLSSPGGSSKSLSAPKSTTREDELKEVFRRFDGDNDGKISAVELRAYFASIGEYMSHQEAQLVINDLDTDGDNLIDLDDFMRLMTKEGEEEDLKAAFEMFEFEKGSGRINPASLQRVLSKLGDSRSHDECAAMIQIYDVDGTGELGFDEFHHMMMA